MKIKFLMIIVLLVCTKVGAVSISFSKESIRLSSGPIAIDSVEQTFSIKKGNFKKFNVICEPDKRNFRWTLDTEKDYEFIKAVYGHLYALNPDFLSKDIYDLLNKIPEINDINSGIIRNEGYLKSIANDKIINQ